MKKLIYSFFAMTLSLGGCSGSTGDFEFVISPDTVSAIKSTAISCLAKKNVTSGVPPTYDITANYAQIKGMSFTHSSDTQALVVSTIEFKFDGGIAVTIAGDQLLALNQDWWDKGEAVVGGPSRQWYSDATKSYTPAKAIKIDCPLYLSGLPAGVAYEPAQSMGFVTVIWRGD
jgi:hypothetical protein